MIFQKTAIAGLYIVETKRLGDERGSFARFFCVKEMQEQTGQSWEVRQINHSFTQQKAAIRGLHFQTAPALEAKFIRCTRGKVLDVAVDLRRNSPTFLQHHKIELSAENGLAFLLPAGFAHGFQALEDNCEMLYLHSAEYAKDCEGGLRYDDPALAIDWALEPSVISERDKGFAYIEANFKGISE